MYFLLLQIFFLLSNTTPGLDQECLPVRIMTYNIRLDHEKDGTDNWHHRKMDMVQYLKSKALTVQSYTTDTPLTKKNRQLSDHFPVIVDIQIQ